MTGAMPPRRHGVQALKLGTQADDGALRLPVCRDCAQPSYPLRELCANCLSERLEWQPVAAGGTVLAATTIHHSNEPYFRPQLPIRIGSVQLDAGPVLIVFLDDGALPGMRVQVRIGRDEGGAAVLEAAPAAASV